MIFEILMLARLTALEVLRSRIAPTFIAMMLILLGIIYALASVTMGSTIEILLDLGLAGISLFCNLAAIILTIQLTQQEREFRTLYVLLPRLSTRCWYVLGKFIGITIVSGLMIFAMGVMLALAAFFLGWTAWDWYVLAIIATWFEVSIIIAIALLFSNSTSLFLAIFYTVMIDITSRFTIVIKKFGDAVGGLINYFTEAVFYLLPNLQAVNVRSMIFATDPVAISDVFPIAAYTLTETGLILAVTSLIYLKRDMHG